MACFDSQSTITRMVSKPEEEGSFSIKSIEIEFQNRKLLEGSVWSVTLWFGSHTGNARLTELLYIVADGWPSIMSPDEFQCLVLS